MHESYDFSTKLPFISGNYVDDKREGNWNTVDIHGNIIQTDIFVHNNIIKSIKAKSPYKQSLPPNDLSKYLIKNLKELKINDVNGKIIIGFTITAAGNLTNPFIVEGTFGTDIDTKLLTILTNCPNWTPAYDTVLNKEIADDNSLSIKINKGKIEIIHFEDNSIRGRVYQLMH